MTGRGREQAQQLGERLRDEPLGICVTSEFQRVRETADLAAPYLPRVVLPELNDPLVGRFEGKTVAEYREWAGSSDSSARPEPGGESRLELVRRYARAFRSLLARPEDGVLAIFHSLPIAYALEAKEGRAPAVEMPFADYATPYPFSHEELDEATALLEDWVANPTW